MAVQNQHSAFSQSTSPGREITVALLQLVNGLGRRFEEGLISAEDCRDLASDILEQVHQLLRQQPPDLQSSREVLVALLNLQISDISQLAIKQLAPLFGIETLIYDIEKNQAISLLQLEEDISKCLGKVLSSSMGEDELLTFLNLYEDLLEHLWLLPYLSNDPEIHTIIVQRGVPPLLHRSERVLVPLQNIQHHSSQFQTKCKSITKAYNRLSKPVDRKFIHQIQQITPESHNPIFLSQLAQLYQDMQEHSRAIDHCMEALALTNILESINEGNMAVLGLKRIIVSNLGIAHYALGNCPQAIEYHQESLAIAKALRDKTGEAKAYSGLGNAHYSLGNYQEAIECHANTIEISQGTGDKAREGKTHGNLGAVYHDLGDYEQSIKSYQQSLTIARALKDKPEQERASRGLGIAYNSLGDHSSAISFHEEALRVAKGIGDKAGIEKAFRDLEKIHSHLGNYHLALKCHKKILTFATDAGDKAEEGKAYTNLGSTHYFLGNNEVALECYEKSLAIAVTLNNQAEKGKIYMNLVSAYHSLGNYQKAIECSEKALAIARDIKDVAGESTVYSNLGAVHLSLGNYPKALEYSERALANVETLGNRTIEESAYINLGNVHNSVGNYQAAIEFYEKALVISKCLKNQTSEGVIYMNLGVAYYKLCDCQSAIICLGKALVISRAINNPSGEGKAYTSLGNVHESHGNYHKAVESHEKALEIAEGLGDRVLEGKIYLNLGSAQQSFGHHFLALQYYEQSLAIAKDLGDSIGQEAAYRHLGIVHRSLGDAVRALLYLGMSFELLENFGSLPEQMAAYIGLGNVYLTCDEYEKAIACLEKARAIASLLKARAPEAQASANLGIIYYSLMNYDKAIGYLERGLTLAQEIDDKQTVALALNNIGACYKGLQKYFQAEEHYQKAVNVFSCLQSSLKKMYHEKITIFEEQAKAYFGLEKVLLLQGKVKEALVISDSRRSRTLADRIRAKLSLDADIVNAPLQIEEMQELARKLRTTFVVYHFDPFLGTDQKLGVWIIHSDNLPIYQELQAPFIFQAIKDDKITPFQDACYSEGATRDPFDNLFANLPGQDLVDETEKEEIAFLRDWYEELIAPIREFLPQENDARIAFVPDGSLMDLPFSILMDPDEKYLFESYTISVTPSIKALHLLTQRSISPSDKNLILGNPLAPNLNPLPNASVEATKVAEATGTSQEQTFIEGDASKSAILARLENSRFIHFACHGYPKAKDRLSIFDGAFYLTPDEQNPEGILYAEEIVECDLNTELVFLSACHSGKGRQQKEGVIGPVRSFLAAGAQSVVATLWQLPDSLQTVEMISQFYEHILGTSEIAQEMGRALDKDEALREVMRMAASGPARHRPWEWGAFFMTGYLQKRQRSNSLC